VLRPACGAVMFVFALAGCGGASTATESRPARSNATASSRPKQPVSTGTKTHMVVSQSPKPPSPPPFPRLLEVALSSQAMPFVPAVLWNGSPVAWISRSSSGFAMLSFKQSAVELRLHSGTTDAGTSGWRYGPMVAGSERRRLVAAFNGGFRLRVGSGGFESFGRVAAPLGDGLGSVVTYTAGTTDIGSWHQEVPAPGRTIASVRQNLPLLIDHGRAASSVGCQACWGATLGGVSDPARSALGIQPGGNLVWVGEHATVSELADALLAAGVVRAVELDINPEWVAGYLYGHRGGSGPLAPVPVVPGQQGIPGQYLAPWSRDFFTVVAR
jgi:hypothetical protein